MASNPNNRKKHASFAGVPRIVMMSESYRGLSTKAKALLLEMSFMFNGKNNGDISVSLSVMQKFGWVRNATIIKAIQELVDADLAIKTREGRFKNPDSMCALYAITWKKIDECKGKRLDIAPTTIPVRGFSLEEK